MQKKYANCAKKICRGLVQTVSAYQISRGASIQTRTSSILTRYSEPDQVFFHSFQIRNFPFLKTFSSISAGIPKSILDRKQLISVRKKSAGPGLLWRWRLSTYRHVAGPELQNLKLFDKQRRRHIYTDLDAILSLRA